jgi:tRNA(Ile2) C34 agmatinyltransferase TiaS
VLEVTGVATRPVLPHTHQPVTLLITAAAMDVIVSMRKKSGVKAVRENKKFRFVFQSNQHDFPP